MSAGHIQQRGPGTWRIKYDVGRDPLTGRRITKYKTVHGAKRDAQRELRELLGAVDRGQHVDPGKLTVGEWLSQWLAEAQHSCSGKTHERFAEIVHKHLAPGIGAIPLAKVQPVHVQSFYAQALTSGRRKVLKSGRHRDKPGLAPATVYQFDRILNLAFKRARELRLIASNPLEGVKRPKIEREEMRVLNAAETARLLSASAGTRYHVPIMLALSTGMRRGEILALQWRALNLTTGSLEVVRSLEQTNTGLRFKSPKTARSRRTIALPAAAVEILQQHKIEQAKERLALGLGRNAVDLVFTQLDGAPVIPNNFSKAITQIARRTGLPEITFHSLRHTHATAMLRANVHPKIVSERLGHATVAITLDTYSHVVPGMQEDAAARIDAGLRQALSG